MSLETLQENLLYRNKSMCAIHANFIKGNRLKMLRLNENGLWLAVPRRIEYPPEFNSSYIDNSSSTIGDSTTGLRYNLEYAVLSNTVWGICNDYNPH